jgi:deoxycytidine triphosphate deaminase
LVDHQLTQALGAAPPLATNVPPNDFTGATSRIQAASLDLTIGDIFVPATDPDDPGGANAPRDKWCLYEGHTAVVRTFETLAVPATLMGIGFPPSSLSTQGILMTNPGEVDPGYAGPLHLTISSRSNCDGTTA